MNIGALVVSVIVLVVSMYGMYVWGEHKDTFAGKRFIVFVFILGVALMINAGYNLGKGHPVEASEILVKGKVYSLEREPINKGNKIYATVTDEYESVYTVIFDKPPPAKFKVLEDKNGQVYMAVP